jgi:hypothetical protein
MQTMWQIYHKQRLTILMVSDGEFEMRSMREQKIGLLAAFCCLFICRITKLARQLASITMRWARLGQSWPRLSEQKFRVDKWSLCRG